MICLSRHRNILYDAAFPDSLSYCKKAETGKMRAAVDGVDAVGEAERGLGKAVVILQGGLDDGAVDGVGDINRLAVAHPDCD